MPRPSCKWKTTLKLALERLNKNTSGSTDALEQRILNHYKKINKKNAGRPKCCLKVLAEATCKKLKMPCYGSFNDMKNRIQMVKEEKKKETRVLYIDRDYVPAKTLKSLLNLKEGQRCKFRDDTIKILSKSSNNKWKWKTAE